MRARSRPSQATPDKVESTSILVRWRRISEPQAGSSNEPDAPSSNEPQTVLPEPSSDEKSSTNDVTTTVDITPSGMTQEKAHLVGKALLENILKTAADQISMRVRIDRNGGTDEVKVRLVVGGTALEASLIELTRLHWIEDAYRITKFVMPCTMNQSRFRVLILEEDNPEDDELLHLHCTGLRHGDFLRQVRPGFFLAMRSLYDVGRTTEANVHIPKNETVTLIVGKAKKNDAPIEEFARMLILLRMKVVKCIIATDGDAPDEAKLDRISVRLSSSIGTHEGRKIVECVWRDLGIKIDYVAEPRKPSRPAPRSSLCYITINAEAWNVFIFQMIYDWLKMKIKPMDHGVEIHKVAHLETGEIRLRMKEIVPGGRLSYAREVRKVSGFDCYLT